MQWYSELKNRLAHLMGRPSFDHSLEDEIQGHIDMRVDDLVASGMTQTEAEAIARREFGATSRIAEDSREAWRWSWLEDLWRDLRYATRTLSRDRGFTVTAVLSLALGIGVNTTVFSLANEFLLSEPSARNPQSMVRIEVGGRGHASMREYRFLRDARVFEDLTGLDENTQLNWRSGDSSQRLFGVRVTDNFFVMTHVPIALGRAIQNGEHDAVVVSHRFWINSLNADPNVMGRAMVLDGETYNIVGVLPANHRTLVGLAFAPDLYLPVRTETAHFGLYGRLHDGDSIAAMTQKLHSACAQMDLVYPMVNQKWTGDIRVREVTGVARFMRGNKSLASFAIFIAMLMLIVGLLLMIACANVASLLLSRAAGRAREFAIRSSIGAGRGRLVRQLLAESLLLSIVGALAGLGLNLALTTVLSGMVLPAPVPLVLKIEPDWRLFCYLMLVAVGCAVTAGLLPALTSTRSGSSDVLKRSEHQVGGGSLLRKVLVTGQLAVSVVVLLTAALFLRNLLESVNMDPGFDIARTSWAQMRPVPEKHPTKESTFALISRALPALRAIPGVESVTFSDLVPLNDRSNDTSSIRTDLRPEPVRVRYEIYGVAKGFFQTMSIPIVAGSDFQDSDRAGSGSVIILNQTLAKMLFGNVSAIGHTIRIGDKPITVVGVAANSKYASLGEDETPAVYRPYQQRGGQREHLHFLIRASVPPATLNAALNKTLLDIDPTAAVEVKPMNQALAFALLPSRAGAGLLGVIGTLGLTLSSVGLYGVLAYSVSRRIREIGLRIALGAQRGDVLRLVLGEGAWILGAGLAIGIFVALFVTRPLTMFLVSGLTPSDPLTYFSVTAVLLIVGCVASLVPAYRALQADPAVALRYE